MSNNISPRVTQFALVSLSACIVATALAGAARQPEPFRLPYGEPKPRPAPSGVPGASSGQFTVEIEGLRQGKFKGEGTRETNKDKIVGLRFDFEMKSPRDPATRLNTGKHTYEPLVITKEWGAASPQIFQASATSEVLSRVVLDFYKATAGGESELFYTIKLTNAQIASLKQYSEDGRFYEDVGLTFQRIEVMHAPSGAKAEDSMSK